MRTFIHTLIGATVWPRPLLIKNDGNARYYVQLASNTGVPVPHGPVIGGFESLDWIVTNSCQIHAELERRIETLREQPVFPGHD